MVKIIEDFIPDGRPNRPGGANLFEYITIHETGNPNKGANAKAHADYLKSDAAVKDKVSWHYTVDDNGACQHLPEDECGWHTGTGKGNASSIGIEICVNSDGNIQKAVNNAAWLCAEIIQRRGLDINCLRRHKDWSGKDCPKGINAGKPVDWDGFKYLVGQQLALMGKPKEPEISDWAKDAHKWAVDNGISDGTRPKEQVTREELWAMLYRYDQLNK